MKKKIVSALLCVAMAASLVVGCGSKSGSDSGSSKGGDKLPAGPGGIALHMERLAAAGGVQPQRREGIPAMLRLIVPLRREGMKI